MAIAGVRIPRTQVCENHVSPFDAFCAAYFAEEPVVVWKASRGFGGKSHLLATLAWTEGITLGASISLLGGSGEQSQRVHGYLAGTEPNARGQFWDAALAPTWLLANDPTKREINLRNGGQVKALMASPTSVRGPHPQRLRLDEIDEMKLDILDSALGQTMGARGIEAQTVCSSTHQHPSGTMSEILMRAKDKGWKVCEWCYKETMADYPRNGWLDPSEVERKKREVSSQMFAIEYDLQEPAPETRAFDPVAVDRMFDKDLGHWRGAPGELIVRVEPTKWEKFYHGTDWARSQDWTIVQTNLDTREGPDELAAWQRAGREPWPNMIGYHNKRIERYGGSSVHDTTGVGDVCADYLTVTSFGFDFRSRVRRTEMLNSYVAAVENGEFRFPMIDFMYGEHKFASMDDLYGYGHIPDSVVASALAWYAKQYAPAEYDPREWVSWHKT